MRIPPMVRVIVLFATVIALALAAFLYVRQLGGTKEVEKPLSITAETPSADRGQRGILVQGTGEVRVRPDTAFVSVGAENTGETAADASGALAATASAIVEAIKAVGVPESDIATERLSLTPIYAPIEGRTEGQGEITGYRATTSVLVTVRDIKQVSNVVDRAITAGSNLLNFVRFGVADEAPLKRQALDAAIRDAASKAEAMAVALGGKLGGLIFISEESVYFAAPSEKMAAVSIEGATMPVEAGELTVTATVRANFAYE